MSGSGSGGGFRWGSRVASVAFLVAAAAGIGVTIVYANGGDPQAEGALLGIALGGVGVGLVMWAHHLLPRGPFVEPRPELGAGARARRRRPTRTSSGGTRSRAGGCCSGACSRRSARSGRPRCSRSGRSGRVPGGPWRPHRGAAGRALITDDGSPVRAVDVPVGGLVTVFPEGHPGSADGQTVLVRIDPEVLARSPSAAGGTAEGLVAFSRVCTHAGCPVGLYQAQLHQLLCPCHQSAFDVLDRAKPVFGPAARALPQLPITIDEHGIVRAEGDFPEPIGPAYWSR